MSILKKRSTAKPKQSAREIKRTLKKDVPKSETSETNVTNSADKSEVIRFYRANEKPYGPFSNLFRRTVEFEGVAFPTAEHAYQAGKAAKPEVRDWILAAPSPALAAMAAHGLYTWDVVPDWAKIKFDRMRRVLWAKFNQHDDLAHLLLSTGKSQLIETGTVDNAVNRLWGEVNGRGENMLGVMLMEVRDKLSTKIKPASKSKKRTNESGQKVPTTSPKLKRKEKTK